MKKNIIIAGSILCLSGLVYGSILLDPMNLAGKKDALKSFKLHTEALAILPVHEHALGRDSMRDAGHHVGAVSEATAAPEDMWVTGMRYEITGAPAFTLHHGTLFRLDERDLECPAESPRPLLSLSQDQKHTSEAHFSEGYGIFIPKGTPLLVDAMFHNPEFPLGPGVVYKDVSLKVELILANTNADLKRVDYHLLRLSDTPCGESGHTFAVPPQAEPYVFAGTQENIDSSRFVASLSSKIIYWGAHLHGWEGGQSLNVKKNGEVLELFETVRTPNDPYRYDTPHGNRDISLASGDVISIEATYQNHTGELLRGAMGHLGFYIAEE